MNIKVTLPIYYPIGREMSHTFECADIFYKAFKRIGYSKERKINIWCRGSSGAILATAFASLCPNQSKICYCRKAGEKQHSFFVNYYFTDGLDIVIDDFIETGHTIENILNEINQNSRTPMVLMVKGAIENKEKFNMFKHYIG